jgi:hypothetical protein
MGSASARLGASSSSWPSRGEVPGSESDLALDHKHDHLDLLRQFCHCKVGHDSVSHVPSHARLMVASACREALNKKRSEEQRAPAFELRPYQLTVRHACDRGHTLIAIVQCTTLRLSYSFSHSRLNLVLWPGVHPGYCATCPYQAADRIEREGGNWVVSAPTNSGKTAIFIELARWAVHVCVVLVVQSWHVLVQTPLRAYLVYHSLAGYLCKCHHLCGAS